MKIKWNEKWIKKIKWNELKKKNKRNLNSIKAFWIVLGHGPLGGCGV